MIAKLIIKNRSCRRFHQARGVSEEVLSGLVNLARLSASAANLQPLKYVLSCDAAKNQAIFDCLTWAAYLSDWPGPSEGERPAAYIVILGDTGISHNFWCDHGIAAQSILLGAREQDLAGCMLAAINTPRLKKEIDLESGFEILLVIALGYPRETVFIETMADDGRVEYWRDDHDIHHVPKRRLQDIILKTYPPLGVPTAG